VTGHRGASRVTVRVSGPATATARTAGARVEEKAAEADGAGDLLAEGWPLGVSSARGVVVGAGVGGPGVGGAGVGVVGVGVVDVTGVGSDGSTIGSAVAGIGAASAVRAAAVPSGPRQIERPLQCILEGLLE